MSVSRRSFPVFVACLGAITASAAAAQGTTRARLRDTATLAEKEVTGLVARGGNGSERTLRKVG